VRLRQAALLIAAMTVVLVALLVPLARLVQTSAIDRAVSAATDKARGVGLLVATVAPEDLEDAVASANINTPRYPATVYFPAHAPIGQPSSRTPAVDLAAVQDRSFKAVGVGGWEVVVAVDASAYAGVVVVRVFVSDAELSRGVSRAWLTLALLGLGALILSVLAGDLVTRAVTRPIRELADVSHQLASGQMEVRSRIHGPAEVRAVAAGLNHLAGRIQDLLRQERESVADISHQLRTPLTALRLEVESTPGAEQLAVHVALLENAVTGVIEQARRTGAPEVPVCDARDVTADRCAFWAALAEDQRRPMRVEIAERRVPVGLSEGDLRTCLDALLGNVFAHTPEGTSFSVTVSTRSDGGARIVVEDAGPGFPSTGDAVRRGTSGAGSSGLGLDIARRSARSSGGDMHLGATGAGGARVTVDLGPPRDSPTRIIGPRG